MNIFSPAQTLGKYPCKKCDRRDFDTIRELSEHEIRAHGAVIPCPHCSRDRSSVQKLVDHLQRRHGTSRLVCHYCKESFSSRIETAKSSIIDDYRAHIYKVITILYHIFYGIILSIIFLLAIFTITICSMFLSSLIFCLILA